MHDVREEVVTRPGSTSDGGSEGGKLVGGGKFRVEKVQRGSK